MLCLNQRSLREEQLWCLWIVQFTAALNSPSVLLLEGSDLSYAFPHLTLLLKPVYTNFTGGSSETRRIFKSISSSNLLPPIHIESPFWGFHRLKGKYYYSALIQIRGVKPALHLYTAHIAFYSHCLDYWAAIDLLERANWKIISRLLCKITSDSRSIRQCLSTNRRLSACHGPCQLTLTAGRKFKSSLRSYSHWQIAS